MRKYLPGDIVLTRGTATLSKLIRFFTRSPGETATQVNHVGILVEGGDKIDDCIIVEALLEVKRRRVGDEKAYARKTGQKLAVYRPVTMDKVTRYKVVQYAQDCVGLKYGPLKLLLHAADWALCGLFVFRRIGRLDKYPICSYLVARCFERVGLDFGVSARAAAPDDIWDFVTTSRHYKQVRPLKKL